MATYPLGHTWQHDGFTLRIIRREGLTVMAEKAPPTSYEVAILRPYKAGIVWGKQHEAGESYPSSEQWGSQGWSYNSLEAAEARFAQLQNRRGEE